MGRIMYRDAAVGISEPGVEDLVRLAASVGRGPCLLAKLLVAGHGANHVRREAVHVDPGRPHQGEPHLRSDGVGGQLLCHLVLSCFACTHALPGVHGRSAQGQGGADLVEELRGVDVVHQGAGFPAVLPQPFDESA